MTPHSYCWEQVSRWDRGRGLALRYAPAQLQDAGLAILAFNLELAKVLPLVSEPALADIRFMWWQEALEELEARALVRNHPVVSALQVALIRSPGLCAGLADLLDGWRQVSRQQGLQSWPDLAANLDATHGRLAAALLTLDQESAGEHAQTASQAYARAWGYASLRQALLSSGDISLLPSSARNDLCGANAPEQITAAAQAFIEQGQAAYNALGRVWGALDAREQGLLASAHLIRARLNDVPRAESLAAWHLFRGRLFGRRALR
jgi:phytoene/squalene synthetase